MYAQQYFPDTVWQTKKPVEVRMKQQVLDSAVAFAIRNENKADYDLRIATLKAYAREPYYKMMGPYKERGKPAGII